LLDIKVEFPVQIPTLLLQQSDSVVEMTCGHRLTRQYQTGKYLYLLKEGTIDVYATREEDDQRIKIGNITGDLAPIGWSAISPPYRYTVEMVVASPQATLLQFDISNLTNSANESAEFGRVFHEFLLSKANALIEESLIHLSKVAPAWIPAIAQESTTQEEFELPDIYLIDFLRRSPFFEVFTDPELYEFCRFFHKRDHRVGDALFNKKEQKEGFYLLKEGWIDFFFENEENGKQILFRSISTPGFNISWQISESETNYARAIARVPSSTYFISWSSLDELLQKNKSLAGKYYQRLLWLVSHQTQMIRTKVLNLVSEKEWIALRNLIESQSAKLELTSSLHEIPHLLQEPRTQQRAFDILHQLHQHGTAVEKQLASVCLDNTQELQKEYSFFQQLIKVYQDVCSLPHGVDPRYARTVCAQAVNHAFSTVSYRVSGVENLPSNAGHIFIYNHLKNDPHNTLPNNFQVTLDSHFISSMILYKQYNDPGLRVVRVGRDIEYGHYDYYSRLQHIDVYTHESDEVYQNHAYREKARKDFFDKAGLLLSQGQNLIISPEGTSYETHESPGIFKSGAFRLALSLPNEPLIVPVVMANFDKRARHNTFVAKILKPIRLSDHIGNPSDKHEMKAYLTTLEAVYRSEIQTIT
jgi:CRP-like cAMP-binding protein